MDASTMIHTLDTLQTLRFTSAAATAFYLYNILITLDLEMEHIWSRFSFNLPILLYILNRYICLILFLITMFDFSGFNNGLSDAYCELPIDAIGFMLAYFGWTGLMALRVCALWRQKPLLVRFIQGMWVCTMATLLATAVLAYQEIRGTITYNPIMRLCASSINVQVFKSTPIAPAIYETLLATLTVVKVFDFQVLPSRATLPMLYYVLARDGVTCFLVTTTITVVNMITWYTLTGPNLYLLCALYWAMASTFIARLVLNLRVAHSESVQEDLGTSTRGGIGAYGTRTEWQLSGTMGYRARVFLGDLDLQLMATGNIVDPDDLSKMPGGSQHWDVQQIPP